MHFLAVELLPDLIITLIAYYARAYCCLYLFAKFVSNSLKGLLLYGVTLVLVLVPMLNVLDQPSIKGMSMSVLLLLIVKECLLGAFLGFILASPCWLMENIGTLFDNQRGVLLGEQINPALTGSDSIFGFICRKIFLLAWFYYGGFAYFVTIFWKSYFFWPIHSFSLYYLEQGFKNWLVFLATIFSVMLIYSAPFITLLLLIEFSIAIIGLYCPRMNTMLISIPVKILVGLFFFTLYIPSLINLTTKQIASYADLPHVLSTIITLIK